MMHPYPWICVAKDCLLQGIVDEEHDGTPQCAVPCKLSPADANGDAHLAGPCGCIGPEGNCNEEFAGGIVKDLCSLMGNNPVTGSVQSSSSFQRKLQGRRKPLQLKAGAE